MWQCFSTVCFCFSVSDRFLHWEGGQMGVSGGLDRRKHRVQRGTKDSCGSQGRCCVHCPVLRNNRATERGGHHALHHDCLFSDRQVQWQFIFSGSAGRGTSWDGAHKSCLEQKRMVKMTAASWVSVDHKNTDDKSRGDFWPNGLKLTVKTNTFLSKSAKHCMTCWKGIFEQSVPHCSIYISNQNVQLPKPSGNFRVRRFTILSWFLNHFFLFLSVSFSTDIYNIDCREFCCCHIQHVCVCWSVVVQETHSCVSHSQCQQELYAGRRLFSKRSSLPHWWADGNGCLVGLWEEAYPVLSINHGRSASQGQTLQGMHLTDTTKHHHHYNCHHHDVFFLFYFCGAFHLHKCCALLALHTHTHTSHHDHQNHHHHCHMYPEAEQGVKQAQDPDTHSWSSWYFHGSAKQHSLGFAN